MKNFAVLLLAAILSGVMPTRAQNIAIDTAKIECRYLEQLTTDTLTRHFKRDTLVLRIGKKSSSFYGRMIFKFDSLLSMPDGRRQWWAMITKLAKEGKMGSMQGTTIDYIYSNYPQGYTTVRTRLSTYAFEYTEKFEPQQWNITDSCRVIGGYDCRLATASFRGRFWSAWFAPDIPVHFGPWKLNGLPGLILEAYDKNEDYKYTLLDLKPLAEETLWFYNLRHETYKKIDRKQLLAAKDRYENMSSSDQVRLITNNKELLELFGNNTPRPASQSDFRERDYK